MALNGIIEIQNLSFSRGSRAIFKDINISIEAGKIADIIAVNGDPLEDISLLQSISFVMKDGKVYKQLN
jgi:ABC-type transporter Mla maintaining outer membrane lipid asymmetry ATPase subunit MlaF